MKVTGSEMFNKSVAGTRRRPALVALSVPGIAVLAIMAAACGSSSSTAASTSTTKATGSTVGGASTTTIAVAKSYLEASGTGNKMLASVVLPAAWTVSWTFDCKTPSTTGTFLLTSAKVGGTPVNVTKQTGLGGGGHKPYSTSGSYQFAVTSACGWKVNVATTPNSPTTSSASTTTSAPSVTPTTVSTEAKSTTTPSS